jgi:hypothetical protein
LNESAQDTLNSFIQSVVGVMDYVTHDDAHNLMGRSNFLYACLDVKDAYDKLKSEWEAGKIIRSAGFQKTLGQAITKLMENDIEVKKAPKMVAKYKKRAEEIIAGWGLKVDVNLLAKLTIALDACGDQYDEYYLETTPRWFLNEGGEAFYDGNSLHAEEEETGARYVYDVGAKEWFEE